MQRTVARMKALGFVFEYEAGFLVDGTKVCHPDRFWYYNPDHVSLYELFVGTSLRLALRKGDRSVIWVAGKYEAGIVFPLAILFDQERTQLVNAWNKIGEADEKRKTAAREYQQADAAYRALFNSL